MLLRKPLHHLRHNVVAYLALFVALGGTSAYAANTIGTGDIIDNQVTSPDVRDDTQGFGGLAHQDLGPNSVRSSEVADLSLGNGDFLTGSVDSRVATDNSLTGADINESSLDLPKETATTFISSSTPRQLYATNSDVAGGLIPGGSWAVVATVTTEPEPGYGEHVTTTTCGLYTEGGRSFIGGTEERGINRKSLSLNGGMVVPANVRLNLAVFCRTTGREVAKAQIMATRVGGLF